MKTTVTAYCFNTRNPEEQTQWIALKSQLETTNGKCFESHGGASHYPPEMHGKTVDLKTDFVTENQWNTVCGKRVFDWAMDYRPNGSIHVKRGHYLEISAEMRVIRQNIHKCGYCGAQEPAQKGYVFCPHCIGSEYLTEKDLHLTRMAPAGASFNANRAPLTEAEKSNLMPQFAHAQIYGANERDKKRIAKNREAAIKKRDEAIRNAENEFSGFSWFTERGLKTDNVIYYPHTGVFCIGWRSKLGAELEGATLDHMAEFPFTYEILCADGRTLTNA